MLISHQPIVNGNSESFIFNPRDRSNPADDEYVRVLASNGASLQSQGTPYFNSSRRVVAHQPDGTMVRFPVGGTPSQYQVFQNLTHLVKVNEASEFACRIRVQIRKNQFDMRAGKIGAVVLWTAPVVSYPNDMNNSGDVVVEYYSNAEYAVEYQLHEGDPNIAGDERLLNIRNMIIAGSHPVGIFDDPTGYAITKVSDRDSTGFGWMTGQVLIGTNPDGSNRLTLFLLVPEILQ